MKQKRGFFSILTLVSKVAAGLEMRGKSQNCWTRNGYYSPESKENPISSNRQSWKVIHDHLTTVFYYLKNKLKIECIPMQKHIKELDFYFSHEFFNSTFAL